MTAVIYARVSSSGNLEGRQNCQRQIDDLNNYAALNGYEVRQIFEEHISGAKKNSERLILTECLDYCISERIDCLLISELSRLGRNVDEVLANVRLAKEQHLNIFLQKEGISIYDADGKENPFLTIMIAVLGTCAQLEREAIAYRLTSGRQRAIREGKQMGRPKGTIMTEEQMKVKYKREIRLLKEGMSIRKTAKLCEVNETTVQKVKRMFCTID